MLLTFREIQNELRLGGNKTWEWCNQKDTPAFKIGKKWFCRRDSLDEWLKEQEKAQKQAM